MKNENLRCITEQNLSIRKNSMSKQMLNKRILSALCALMLMLTLGIPQVASAVPSSKMAEAAAAKKQIDALNTKLDKASDNYYTAQQKLDKARAAQQANQAKLDKTKARLSVVQGHLNDRAANMYRTGPTGFANVLFGATDFQQFAQLWDFLGELNQQDAASSMELKKLRDEATTLQATLDANEKQAKDSAKQMAQIKRGVEKDLAARKGKLAGLESEIAQLQAQETAAAAARARRGIGPSGGSYPAPSYQPNGDVVAIARQYLGAPYVWAASGPNSFDCSGFTMFVYRQVGISLPHSSRAQINCGARVSRSDLEPGDLVFFGSPIHHVGLYIGDGMMIHAPQTGDVVKIAPLQGNFAGACRPR